MADLVVPPLGESITEAVVSRWLKQVGEPVAADEPVAELETDKVTVELPSPVAGALAEQRAAVGRDGAGRRRDRRGRGGSRASGLGPRPDTDRHIDGADDAAAGLVLASTLAGRSRVRVRAPTPERVSPTREPEPEPPRA